ncbi:MAG: cysteine--tRNA ligase [Candidatus Omnitrophica bacterium]|nr:cysteine--tRNA ligase [Candidatus Omnitrophota bacterium]
MSLYIYNSLTRKKEEFIPLNPPQVNIYTCGVTVYDESHIGHARSLYLFDVMRRYLEYRGFKVNFVRNITDIEDKIINRAKELGINWDELVEKYIQSYKQDLALLKIREGILDGNEEPRATKNIEEIKEFIQILIDKDFAYPTKTGVYFRVRRFEDYGKLSGQSIESMLAGARIEPDETKADPLDFALWKISQEDEPGWESPWGRGRPGWHIECSVMSLKYLKTDTLDIHGGGRDLIFPHHENEIAQSQAKTGKPFARYWIHHGLLTINGQKMAKSLGNFVTIKDFMTRYKDADLLKLFFLSTHYSHPIDYNAEKIEEAKKQKISFWEFFDKVNFWQEPQEKKEITVLEEDFHKIDALAATFVQAMDDDFNTPQAMAHLFELLDLGSLFVAQDKFKAFSYAKEKLEEFFAIFGLEVKPKKDLPAEIKKYKIEREIARKNKDFEKADRLRQEIEKSGYRVIDTAVTTTFTESSFETIIKDKI